MDKHHKHIDNLRGLAILMVMAFHLWPDIFKGGYVGVDFFFVISGFVLMGSLQRSTNAWSFVWKRIVRLVPAVWFLCLSTSLFLISLPKNIALQAFEDILNAAFFLSSFSSVETPDYFEQPFNDHFFTHMWSLSVEMQISLLLGLGLALYSVFKHRLLWPTIALSVLSFLLFLTPVFSEIERYFLSPFRFWAFALGMGLALWLPVRSSLPYSIFGVFILVAALALGQFDFILPGAAVASFSVALLIVFGSKLHFAPLSELGKISFGVYLWHLPLLVLAHALFDMTGPFIIVLWFVVSFFMGWVSLRFIERPAQRAGRNMTQASTQLGALFFGFFFVLIFSTIPFAVSSPGHKPQHDAFANCHHFFENPDKDCLNSDAPYFFWGDSHMGVLAGPVTEWSKDGTAQASFLSQNGCPPRGPLLGETSPKTPSRLTNEGYCQATQELGWNEAQKHDTVVLTAHFLRHITTDKCGMSCPIFEDFESLVRDLEGVGKRVVVIGPEPQRDEPAFFTQAIRHVFGLELEDIPRPEMDAKLKDVTDWLNTLPAEIIWPVDALCTDTTCPAVNSERVPYFFDRDHLSAAGADVVFEHIQKQLEKD